MSTLAELKSRGTALLENKLVAYFLIGGVASVIDVGLFLLLHEVFEIRALVAHSISIPVSALYSFICNAFFNFRTVDKLFRRAASFAIVVGLGYLLGAGVIAIVESQTSLGGSVGKIISLPLVFAFQFYVNSRISFRSST